ncbi:MAG: restriction endonuclease subunit S, partial [Anaerolineales bacterium]|nr:restriction endonuclease subunit S [Anaerolineales bacterium]
NTAGTYLFSNFTVRLRPNQSLILPKYLHYYLRSPKARQVIADMHRTTSGLRNLQMSDYLSQPVMLPFPDNPERSLVEQRRIVARIEALLAEVREMRKLHGEITADTGELMASVRHELFSQLTDVAILKFDDIAESRLGKMLSKSAKTGQYSKPYMRNANVLWDEFKLDDVLEMDFPPEEQEKFRLKVGDLLICEGGEIGRTAVWNSQIGECYFQKALHRARLRDNKASPRYLMHFMAWAATNGEIAKLHTGSAIPHLTGVKLKTLDVLWPEPEKQFYIRYLFT